MNKVVDTASIVLIGSFNPGIYHPVWFQKQRLLQEVEIEKPAIEIINNDIAIFTAAWLRIEVTGDKFIAATEDESKFDPLCDLVIGTFRLLDQTPIQMIGMNREVGFELRSSDEWHKVGHVLAPKEVWQEIDSIHDPGMLSLVMQSQRQDEYEGKFNITVKPLKPNTVSVAFNNHIEIKKNDNDLLTAEKACEVIEAEWRNSLSRSLEVASELIQKALNNIKRDEK
ncbi:MAG: hypothetical protein H6936_08720 [Burkholderiales bacterium]|nr:hypothetical protein [Burkholderiales bacterium]